MLTMSLVMMPPASLYQHLDISNTAEYIPIATTPAAPKPQNARAAMKLPMLCARAHHPVVADKSARPNKYSGRLPTVSDMRPKSGCREVDVSKKAVDNHDAELDAWK
jgi:hypothetical protein